MNRFLFFSKGQQIGIIILLVLIVLGIVFYALLPTILPNKTDENDSTLIAQVANFESSLRDKPREQWQSPFEAQHQEERVQSQPTHLKQLIDFDPNTLDSTSFDNMGFASSDIHRIMNFRRNGKQFRTAEFFVEYCHLPQEQNEQLLPHVHIAPTATAQTHVADTVIRPSHKSYVHIELNSADTTLLQQMPGIGSGRAKQIVAYRAKLGGFTDPKQLLEITNFQVETYDKMKDYLSVDKSLVKRIQVNKASVDKLKSHPYLNFYQAKAIYDLRREKGTLSNIDELKTLDPFKGYDFTKLEPYLDFSKITYDYKRK